MSAEIKRRTTVHGYSGMRGHARQVGLMPSIAISAGRNARRRSGEPPVAEKYPRETPDQLYASERLLP